MPDDIFDQAAKAKPAKPSGDIFDQAAPSQIQIPDATAQAKAMFPQPGTGKAPLVHQFIPGTSIIDPTQGRMAAAQAGQNPAYSDYMKQSGIQAGITAGTMGAAALVPQLAGAGLGTRAANLGLRSAATGAGAGAGSLAGGATPEEAKTIGIAGAASQPVAEAVTGIAGKIPPLTKWIMSSKTQGAKFLEQASQKAGNAPVAISPETDRIVEQITKEGKLGSVPPKVISDFLERVGPSIKQSPFEQSPLTYDEARILQSNASSLSASEKASMKGRMGGLMKQFANSFSNDVQAAADQAGVGAEHAAGMKKYALASSRNRTLKNLGKYALPTVGGAGLAYELFQGIRRAQQ